VNKKAKLSVIKVTAMRSDYIVDGAGNDLQNALQHAYNILNAFLE